MAQSGKVVLSEKVAQSGKVVLSGKVVQSGKVVLSGKVAQSGKVVLSGKVAVRETSRNILQAIILCHKTSSIVTKHPLSRNIH